MSLRYATLDELLDATGADDPEAREERWDRWQDPTWQSWWKRDYENREEFLLDYISDTLRRDDIEYDDVAQQWCVVHHRGLSCFAIEAATEAEAVATAAAQIETIRERIAEWGWWGDTTTGNVRLVGQVSGCEDWLPYGGYNAHVLAPWYVFEAEDTEEELRW